MMSFVSDKGRKELLGKGKLLVPSIFCIYLNVFKGIPLEFKVIQKIVRLTIYIVARNSQFSLGI